MTTEVAGILAQARQLTPLQQLELIQGLAGLASSALVDPASAKSPQAQGTVLNNLLSLATELGVSDLAEQHDHYLYGTERQ
jgi:hypothetical protein